MRLFLCILLGMSFSLSIGLFGQPKFKLVPVDQVETSHNTVTCTIHKSGSQNYIYSAGGGNKIDVFKVQADGKMQFLTNYVVSGGQNTVRGLITDQIGGNDFLFAGLKGGNAAEVFKINPNGTHNSVFVMPDTDTTYLGIVITLEVIHMESASYLFVGGLENTPGLSPFRVTAKGRSVVFVCRVCQWKSACFLSARCALMIAHSGLLNQASDITNYFCTSSKFFR